MIKKTRIFLKKYWFISSAIVIVLISIFFRFINYDSRWGLASDQARDAIIGSYAVENFKFPLIGSFSSAGPFQTGAQWYWFIMLGTAIFRNSFLGPWIFLGIIYVISVILMILVGKILIGGKFGLLIGIFLAVSTAEITQSTNLTNPSLLSFSSLLSILFMILYVKSKRLLYLFFLAFSISFGIGVHLQGIPLLFLLALMLLLIGFPSKKGVVVLFLGLLIPTIPFFLYEIMHNFFNIKNMAYYYFHDQYNISFEVLGRRWLTYVGFFLPQAWSHILGGFPVISYVSIFFVGIITVLKLIKRSISKDWIIILSTLLFSLFALRYARTPLYYGYIVFLHPFIIIITGWATYFTYRYNKVVGIILFSVLVIGSCYKNYSEIINAKNDTAYKMQEWGKLLVKLYPNDLFAIYDLGYRSSGSSLPLVLYLYREGKISDSGRRIGFGFIDEREDRIHPQIKGNTIGSTIRDLQRDSPIKLQKEGWELVNPKMIYNSIENWN